MDVDVDEAAVTSRDPHLMFDPWQEQLSGQGNPSPDSREDSLEASFANTGT